MSAVARNRPILVAEDSDEDFYALTRAFSRLAPDAEIVRAVDGDEALEHLKGETMFGLLVLDLNLPGTDGREVLEEIKGADSDDGWSLPVIILSSSSSAEDVTRSYRDGANAYVRKALDPADYEQSIEALKSFWMDSVILPADYAD